MRNIEHNSFDSKFTFSQKYKKIKQTLFEKHIVEFLT